MYQARVRIGRAGRLWLSVVKVCAMGPTVSWASRWLLPGSRYRNGRSLTVRAQAIKAVPDPDPHEGLAHRRNRPRPGRSCATTAGAICGTAGRTGIAHPDHPQGDAAERHGPLRQRARHSRRSGHGGASRARTGTAARPRTPPRTRRKPRILKFTTGEVSDSSAVVRWSLDEPVIGFVQYGRTKAYTERVGSGRPGHRPPDQVGRAGTGYDVSLPHR